MTTSAHRYPEGWRPRSLQEILSRTPQPPPWVIEGLLPAQSGILCSGQPHATKSLNWLFASMESVIHHVVWGKFPCQKVSRVLFIETEDPSWLVETRIHGFAKGLGLKPGDDLTKYGFYFACTGPFELTSCEEKLLALIDEVKPDWVILSTLQGLLNERDWKEQKDMGPVNAIMVRLQRRVPLVVITHSPRDSNARRSAGSITQDANYLVTMHFKKADDKNTGTVISVVGDSKMGVELKFDLTLVTESVKTPDGKVSTEVRRIVHGTHKETLAQTIRAYHKENPRAKPQEISDAVGTSPQYVRKVLRSPEPRPVSPPSFFDEPEEAEKEKPTQ
jgi:hypothetical protein